MGSRQCHRIPIERDTQLLLMCKDRNEGGGKVAEGQRLQRLPEEALRSRASLQSE